MRYKKVEIEGLKTEIESFMEKHGKEFDDINNKQKVIDNLTGTIGELNKKVRAAEL